MPSLFIELFGAPFREGSYESLDQPEPEPCIDCDRPSVETCKTMRDLGMYCETHGAIAKDEEE